MISKILLILLVYIPVYILINPCTPFDWCPEPQNLWRGTSGPSDCKGLLVIFDTDGLGPIKGQKTIEKP